MYTFIVIVFIYTIKTFIYTIAQYTVQEMKVYGYARVSTRGQEYEMQEEQIKAYCKFKEFELLNIFADKKSGKTLDRPQFKEMIELLETNPYNVGAIIVTKLDRIGRSIRDLILFIDWCSTKNIGFIAIGSNIDTTTKEGRLFFYLMGALSEYERELIMERTEAGIEKYKESGGKLGRKPKQVNIREMQKQIAMGVSKSEVARKFKINRTTLYKRLEDEKSKDDNHE